GPHVHGKEVSGGQERPNGSSGTRPTSSSSADPARVAGTWFSSQSPRNCEFETHTRGRHREGHRMARLPQGSSVRKRSRAISRRCMPGGMRSIRREPLKPLCRSDREIEEVEANRQRFVFFLDLPAL